MNPKLSTLNFQLLTILMVAFFVLPLKAQVMIGKDSIPHTFSLLELSTKSINGGLRLPQLTSHQRDSIKDAWMSTPDAPKAEGLVIFNTDINCLEFWNGKKWVSLCSDAEPQASIVTGTGTLSGRIYSDDGVSGTLAGRTWKADFSQAAINMQNYVFTASDTGTVSNVRYNVSDTGGVLTTTLLAGTLDSGTMTPGSSDTLKLNFKNTLSTITSPIARRTRNQADSVTITITYYNGKEDLSTSLTAKIQDDN